MTSAATSWVWDVPTVLEAMGLDPARAEAVGAGWDTNLSILSGSYGPLGVRLVKSEVTLTCGLWAAEVVLGLRSEQVYLPTRHADFLIEMRDEFGRHWSYVRYSDITRIDPRQGSSFSYDKTSPSSWPRWARRLAE